MRFAWIAVFAPLALVACGGDETPVIVNNPPDSTADEPTVMVPDDDEAVVVDPDDDTMVVDPD